MLLGSSLKRGALTAVTFPNLFCAIHFSYHYTALGLCFPLAGSQHTHTHFVVTRLCSSCARTSPTPALPLACLSYCARISPTPALPLACLSYFADLLAVQHTPEWPAAQLLLRRLVMAMNTPKGLQVKVLGGSDLAQGLRVHLCTCFLAHTHIRAPCP